MGRHIVYIDELEKLVIKKDSSLLLAHELKRAGENVKILFKNDLCISSRENIGVNVYDFNSKLSSNLDIENFEVTKIDKIN